MLRVIDYEVRLVKKKYSRKGVKIFFPIYEDLGIGASIERRPKNNLSGTFGILEYENT